MIDIQDEAERLMLDLARLEDKLDKFEEALRKVELLLGAVGDDLEELERNWRAADAS
jgi:hypothetical protein